MDDLKLALLRSLSKQFPTIAAASTEIVNLSAILNLPKGTEHFLSDIHGAADQFGHVLRNGSGTIRTKIEDEFGGVLSEEEKRDLAVLIYYPQERMEEIARGAKDLSAWYAQTLVRLVALTKRIAGKYTRSKVRKALPADFAYVIEELITERAEIHDKEAYYREILQTILRLDRAYEFIIALCGLIRRLTVDQLHIVGDIYDRGPGPHVVMDELMRCRSVDVQWGNHDVLWMGAAAGSPACICNVIRICARYGNLRILEEGYGISLQPLSRFAADHYKDVTNNAFSIIYDERYDTKDLSRDMKIHKAVTVMQMKLEGQIIRRRPEFGMEDRLLLGNIDHRAGTVRIGRRKYDCKTADMPTVDPADPCALTPEEEEVIERLAHSFLRSARLQRHVRFLYTNGSMYRLCNGNLIYHGCVPMEEGGAFRGMEIGGAEVRGRALFDALEYHARKGYFGRPGSEEKSYGEDILWYIWTGPCSPLFGKDRMKTFERYFVDDRKTHEEKKDPYFRLCAQPGTVDRILAEFGLDGVPGAHIINGHVPQIMKKNESPVKCGGRLLVIDGGFSRAHRDHPELAGYTLVSDSHGLQLVAHEAFVSTADAIRRKTDILPSSGYIETYEKRRLVADTDIGAGLIVQIRQLEELLQAYRDGVLIERS